MTVERCALPESGLVRLPEILAPRGPIPVSKATWWQGVKDGRFPKPIQLTERIAAWRVEDIRAILGERRDSTAAA